MTLSAGTREKRVLPVVGNPPSRKRLFERRLANSGPVKRTALASEFERDENRSRFSRYSLIVAGDQYQPKNRGPTHLARPLSQGELPSFSLTEMSCHFQVRVVECDHKPQNGSLGRKLAHHDDEVALVVQKFGNYFSLELARHGLFRTNVGDPLRQRFLSRLGSHRPEECRPR